MEATSSGTGREAPGQTMKIYFCDICNESIPLKDINSNRISIEEGKIFCQKCAPKKAKSGDRAPGGLVATVGLLVVAGVILGGWGAKVASDLDAAQRTLKHDVGTAASRIEAMETRLAEIGGSLSRELLPRLEKVADNLTTCRSELAARLDGLDRRESGDHEAQKRELERGFEALGGRMEGELGAVKRDVQALQVELAGQKVGVDAVKDQIGFLKEMVASRGPAEAAAPAKDAAPAEVSAAPASPREPDALEAREVNTLIAQLADADPGKRYSAVVELGRYSGPKVVKALEGMLGDAEDYIRQSAIQNLRKLGSVVSFPLIVSALRDKDFFVRLTANMALRALSGADQNFDPDGSPSERESKVKEWERWWEANKDRLIK